MRAAPGTLRQGRQNFLLDYFSRLRRREWHCCGRSSTWHNTKCSARDKRPCKGSHRGLAKGKQEQCSPSGRSVASTKRRHAGWACSGARNSTAGRATRARAVLNEGKKKGVPVPRFPKNARGHTMCWR